MGARSSSVRVRAFMGAIVASAMLVLMAPSIALAANTATFSLVSPKSGSYSLLSTPKISVTAYDRYGAKRADVSMYLDGAKVTYAGTYIVAGSWDPKKPDYRRLRLTYQVLAPLRVGTHTVVVKVHDLKSKNSTYTWTFSVDSETPAATFSALTPTDNSSSETTLPRISANVADRWDVRGTGSYSMTVDGSAVPASITYTTSGQYRSLKVAYQITRALAPGSHSVTVSVHDAADRTTSQSWSFTVIAPAPVYAEMPVEGAGCADCHSGFPQAHPTTNCVGCHGAGAPPRPASSLYAGSPMSQYAPGDTSAHTLGCFLENPCHGGGGAFPHTVGTDCLRCHNPRYPSIPQAHSVDATAIQNLHVSTPSFCTTARCHSGSLTAEHFRTDSGRTALACGSCHASTNPVVIAAIAAGKTACIECHDLASHPNTTTSHAAVGSCVRSGCHSPSVTTIHKNNCAACHTSGVIPSTNCASCHAAGAYHVGQTAAHALSTGGCIAYSCHGVGVGMDAALTHKNNCTRCHNATDTPSLNCVGCHSGAVLALHPAATTPHTPAATFCTTSNCHGTDVAVTHLKSQRGCTACHAEGVTPSTTCATCHSGDQTAVHKNAAVAHDVSGSTCMAVGCHSLTDASALHNVAGGPGCVACHADGQTPTLVCATCHPGTLPEVHAKAGGNHTSVNNSCIVAGCHLADVTAVHTKCSACHGGSKPLSAVCTNCHTAGIVPIHASADTSHTAPVGTCQTVCHPTNVAAIHEIKTSCIACHNPDGHVPSVVCADCHTGTANQNHSWAIAGHVSSIPSCQLPGCHSTDVVTVHAKRPGQGCSCCHGAGKTPSKVCGDCHVGDVSNLHTGADASHAVPSGMTCASAPQCHASNVSVIHAATTSDCAACHAEGVPATTTCAACHAGNDEFIHRFGDAKHGAPSSGCVSALPCHSTDVSSIHNAGPSCAACHATGKTPGVTCAVSGCHLGDQSARHATAAGTAHDIAGGGCITDGCHGTTAGGVNAAILHRAGPGCVACHADGVKASLVCADCHAGVFDAIHTRGNAYHTAPQNSCQGSINSICHGLNVITLHTATGGPGCAACHAPGVTASARCANCHTGQYWGDIHKVGTKHNPIKGTCVTSSCHAIDVATTHSANAPTLGPGCSPCHRVGTLTIDCTTCHTVDMTPRHSAQDAVHTAAAGFCVNSSCHGGSDSGVNVASLHASSASSCAACHADGKTPSTDCLTCHSGDALTIHPTIGTKHDAPFIRGGCVRDGCHGSSATGANLVELHAAPWPGHTAPGCAACHGPGKTPSATCSATGCHATAYATEHAKYVNSAPGGGHNGTNLLGCASAACHSNPDVSRVHTIPGCVCHQPGKTTTTACNTFGCHPEGFPAVHTPGVAAHAFVERSCASTQCHVAAIDTLHSGTGGPKCVACHAAGAGPATTADCATCHVGTHLPTPSSSPSHPSSVTADSTHTVAATGCSRANCHSTNLVTVHNLSASKCMACHGSGKKPSRVCSSCHAADFAPPHPAPAAEHATPVISCNKAGCHNAATVDLIHVKGGTTHCDACHADGVTPTLTCTAAACHGAGAFPPAHPAPEAIHLTQAGNSCTSLCHQTATGQSDVSKLHVTAGSVKHCEACHATGRPASTVCGTCHTSGTYHAAAAAKHAVTNGCTGGACHNGDVSVIHVKGGAEKCYACHAAGTVPSTNCTNCHGGGADHTASHDSLCNGCHSDMSGDHGGNQPTIGTGNCYACHGTPGATYTHPAYGCGCHASKPGPWILAF